MPDCGYSFPLANYGAYTGIQQYYRRSMHLGYRWGYFFCLGILWVKKTHTHTYKDKQAASFVRTKQRRQQAKAATVTSCPHLEFL